MTGTRKSVHAVQAYRKHVNIEICEDKWKPSGSQGRSYRVSYFIDVHNKLHHVNFLFVSVCVHEHAQAGNTCATAALWESEDGSLEPVLSCHLVGLGFKLRSPGLWAGTLTFQAISLALKLLFI